MIRVRSYDPIIKGYKLYNPSIEKTIVKRNFKFNGKSAWCKDHYLYVLENQFLFGV